MSRLVAALAALSTLAGAGNAAAQDLLPAARDAVPAAGQVLQQASQTVQAANAPATVVQQGATNVAAPVVAASPGAQTTAVQTNHANAAAAAANQAGTIQVAALDQAGATKGAPAAGDSKAAPAQDSGQAGPKPDAQPPQANQGQQAPLSGQAPAGQAQAMQQLSSTTQAAGAQATAVQTNTVNVAIPIVIASPGANTVVVQTNAASAGASATNTAGTAQVAAPVQTGSGQSPPASGSGQAQPPPGGGVGSSMDQFLNTIVPSGSSPSIWIWNWEWNWDWEWNWNSADIPLPDVPSVPGLPSMPSVHGLPEFPSMPDLPSVPGWTPSWDGGWPSQPTPQAEEPRNPAGAGKGSNGSSISFTSASQPARHSLPPGPLDTASDASTNADNASSNFVQRPAKPQLEPIFLPPLERESIAAGAASGGGIAPLTIVFGALLALVLQLATSAGLLGRRLSLRGAGLRRQAYLTPLERPG